jgi:hypothetical protein
LGSTRISCLQIFISGGHEDWEGRCERPLEERGIRVNKRSYFNGDWRRGEWWRGVRTGRCGEELAEEKDWSFVVMFES